MISLAVRVIAGANDVVRWGQWAAGFLTQYVRGKMVSGTCEKMCFEDGGAGISGEGR
jgi:hypothetical protein